jgi:hypothetical protein
MKRKRLSEEQIIEILRLHNAGRSLPICAASTGLEHRTLMLTHWRNRNVGRSSNIGLA